LEKTVGALGYELVDLELANRGRLMRIFIDKADGVDVEDCATVSNHLTRLLIVEGVDYDRLEVSSPGAERPLRSHEEYERFNGKRVNVRYRSGESETVVEGQLVAVDAAGIAVSAPGARGRAPVIIHITWEDVVAGRLAVAI